MMENTNGRLRALNAHAYHPELLHAVALRLLVSVSVKLSSLVLGHAFVPNVYDLGLLNDAVIVQERVCKLGIKPEEVSTVNYTQVLDEKFYMTSFTTLLNPATVKRPRRGTSRPRQCPQSWRRGSTSGS